MTSSVLCSPHSELVTKGLVGVRKYAINDRYHLIQRSLSDLIDHPVNALLPVVVTIHYECTYVSNVSALRIVLQLT